MNIRSAKYCGTIKNMLEDTDSCEEEIYLDLIDGETMQKVIEYCDYRVDHPIIWAEKNIYFASYGLRQCQKYEPWEIEWMAPIPYFGKDSLLFRLMKAASFLDVEPLVFLCAYTISELKGDLGDEAFMKKMGLQYEQEEEEEEEPSKESAQEESKQDNEVQLEPMSVESN
jgi:hypothetical protein